MEAIRVFVPDIAILDISMPDISGLDILAFASAEKLATRLVFFTTSVEARDLATLAAAGACCVIPKDAEPEDLLRTLRQVAEGQGLLALSTSEESIAPEQGANADKNMTLLTERERQIMLLVAEGLSNKEIGRRLNITDGTIKVHLHHIFQKLDVNNRTVLAALAISQSDNSDPPSRESNVSTLR
jgi:RNA polymerase sigma factor (sigma-70 family)